MTAEADLVLPMRLESLTIELIRNGLCVEGRVQGGQAMLKVWHPDLTVTGLSVTEDLGKGAKGPKSALWFRASGGEWLAPCNDIPLAVDVIRAGLERWVRAVHAPKRGMPGAG